MPATYEYLNPVIDKCMIKENALSQECIIKNFCPQLSGYFVKAGIIIIGSYIAISWLSSWYLKKGYLKHPVPNNAIWGDINKLETRIYWDDFIKTRLAKLMIGYITVVIYLNW